MYQILLCALASLCGGSFYESFAELERAVRTGQESFNSVIGQHHFDYFADRPELGFNQAMAFSATTFGQVAELVEASRARVVVDIAGGNGELLKRILQTVPDVRGILFERPDVLSAAQANLTGYLDRCEFVAGDFTSEVPAGGDIYLLSRVLHDWDDHQCKAILDRCVAAINADTELFVLERISCSDDSPSLAAA
jgi:hypothetical protein